MSLHVVLDYSQAKPRTTMFSGGGFIYLSERREYLGKIRFRNPNAEIFHAYLQHVRRRHQDKSETVLRSVFLG